MVQDYLENPTAAENVSSYAEYQESEMTEWEFLSEIVQADDCGIPLDVNNIQGLCVVRVSTTAGSCSCNESIASGSNAALSNTHSNQRRRS
jgi:hypothetical protein